MIPTAMGFDPWLLVLNPTGRPRLSGRTASLPLACGAEHLVSDESETRSFGMCAAGSPAPAQAISAQEAAQRADQAVFIDVREAHELDSGTIHEARHIPLRTLLDSADTITDIAADTPIIVYCQRGPRSVSAASRLVALGFTHVAHITGGIERWTDEYAQEARTRRTSTSSTKAI